MRVDPTCLHAEPFGDFFHGQHCAFGLKISLHLPPPVALGTKWPKWPRRGIRQHPGAAQCTESYLLASVLLAVRALPPSFSTTRAVAGVDITSSAEPPEAHPNPLRPVARS